MTMNLRNFALAAAAATTLAIGTLVTSAAPAAAHEVCDWDGDDCWDVHSHYYDRDWDGWRQREWHNRRVWELRREWEERRDREVNRRWYWSQRPYYAYPGYGGSSVWFNF